MFRPCKVDPPTILPSIGWTRKSDQLGRQIACGATVGSEANDKYKYWKKQLSINLVFFRDFFVFSECWGYALQIETENSNHMTLFNFVSTVYYLLHKTYAIMFLIKTFLAYTPPVYINYLIKTVYLK